MNDILRDRGHAGIPTDMSVSEYFDLPAGEQDPAVLLEVKCALYDITVPFTTRAPRQVHSVPFDLFLG